MLIQFNKGKNLISVIEIKGMNNQTDKICEYLQVIEYYGINILLKDSFYGSLFSTNCKNKQTVIDDCKNDTKFSCNILVKSETTTSKYTLARKITNLTSSLISKKNTNLKTTAIVTTFGYTPHTPRKTSRRASKVTKKSTNKIISKQDKDSSHSTSRTIANTLKFGTIITTATSTKMRSALAPQSFLRITDFYVALGTLLGLVFFIFVLNLSKLYFKKLIFSLFAKKIK
jgi:hypothetical protein